MSSDFDSLVNSLGLTVNTEKTEICLFLRNLRIHNSIAHFYGVRLLSSDKYFAVILNLSWLIKTKLERTHWMQGRAKLFEFGSRIAELLPQKWDKCHPFHTNEKVPHWTLGIDAAVLCAWGYRGYENYSSKSSGGHPRYQANTCSSEVWCSIYGLPAQCFMPLESGSASSQAWYYTRSCYRTGVRLALRQGRGDPWGLKHNNFFPYQRKMDQWYCGRHFRPFSYLKVCLKQ